MIESNGLKTLQCLLTFWRPAKYTNLADLRARLTNVGYNGFCPDPRTPEAALKDALEDYFGRNHMIQWLDAASSFEVVKIERGEKRNTYTQAYRFAIDKAGALSLDPYDYNVGAEVIGKYNQHLALVRATAVTTALRRIATRLNATSPHDGIWWLPAERAAEWRRIAEAIEGCQTPGKGTRVYLFNHDIGEDELRAVRDGLQREVQQAADEIHADVVSGELGARALDARGKRAVELRRKIGLYESILHTGLGDLAVIAERAETAACMAAIAASAKNEAVPA